MNDQEREELPAMSPERQMEAMGLSTTRAMALSETTADPDVLFTMSPEQQAEAMGLEVPAESEAEAMEPEEAEAVEPEEEPEEIEPELAAYKAQQRGEEID